MLKLKVCGMKYPENINEISELNPDYLGFIFYPKSKRYMADNLDTKTLHAIPKSIKKVGVFVNESFNTIINYKEKYQLDLIQLHGNESPALCKQLHLKSTRLIKAFHLNSGFDFEILEAYKSVCDYFLFDTQTALYGGSGQKFNWQVLTKYDNEIPFFLSGGIDLNDANKILNIKNLNIHAIDINSRFEIKPGLKDIRKVKQFKNKLQGL